MPRGGSREGSRSRGRGSRRSRSRSRSDSGRRNGGRSGGLQMDKNEKPLTSGASASKGPGGGQVKTVKKVRKEVFSAELGYKDESNPFGDQSLTEKFVWKKRNEYLQAAGLYKQSSKDQEVDRIQSKVREIHQVKKRRDEREVERQLLEKQRAEHDRERHDELYDEWLGAEEKFHLDNAKARSLNRIEQGRERPMDLVVKALAIAAGQQFEDMTILERPPQQLFTSLGLSEVEEMLTDIEVNLKSDPIHKVFWKAMLYACNDAVEAKQRDSSFGAGVAEGVASEIHELLSSKNKPELEEMLIEIKASLNKGGAGMDTQFFDAVAAKVPLYVAHAEINEWHTKAKKKADAWEAAQEPDDKADAGRASSPPPSRVRSPSPPSPDGQPAARGRSPAAAGSREAEWEELPAGGPQGGSERGDFSPELEPLSALEGQKGAGRDWSPVLEPLGNYDEQDLLDPEEDDRIMRQVRKTLIEAFCDLPAASSSGGIDRSRDEALFRAEQARGMEGGDTAFNAPGKGTGDDFHGEFHLPQRHYEWEDKYKPRKPRFFNRVKTGYEWNKYNQTHYDHDNPPPKRVQGYKFNVFYPDLIDKTKAPIYYLEKDETAETVTLRFHAGPPYEDVAFKIVNCEWNLSHKFGFRVVFDRGVLQLYFNFKRWRYRR